MVPQKRKTGINNGGQVFYLSFSFVKWPCQLQIYGDIIFITAFCYMNRFVTIRSSLRYHAEKVSYDHKIVAIMNINMLIQVDTYTLQNLIPYFFCVTITMGRHAL